MHEHGHLAELVGKAAASGLRLRRRLLLGFRRRLGRGRGGRLALVWLGQAALGRLGIRVESLRRVRDRRIPEDELVDPVAPRGLDLATHLRRAVRDAEREVLEPRNHARACAPRLPAEVTQRPQDDLVGLAVRIGDVVLAGAPVRGVDHRRDVVRLSRHRGDVLRDLGRPSRRDPEDREPEERPVGLEREPRLADELDDRVLRSAAQSREDHALTRAVGTSNVVVEHVVDPRACRGHGDVDVVLPDGRVGEVREPAVARVLRAVGRLHDAVALAALPGGRSEDRIAEAHEPADHTDPARMHLLHDVVEVVDVSDRTDLAAERHGCVEAHLARLVLEVDLDRVDPFLVDQLHHAAAKIRIGPAVRRDVHRPHRFCRPPRDDVDRHAASGAVSREIDRLQQELPRQRRREARREASVVDFRGATRDHQLRPGLDRSLENERLARPGGGGTVELDRRRRRVDGEAPASRRLRAEEAAASLDLHSMLPVRKLTRSKRLGRALAGRAGGDVAAVELPPHVARAGHGELELRQAGGVHVRATRRACRFKRRGKDAACARNRRREESDRSDHCERDETALADRRSRDPRTPGPSFRPLLRDIRLLLVRSGHLRRLDRALLSGRLGPVLEHGDDRSRRGSLGCSGAATCCGPRPFQGGGPIFGARSVLGGGERGLRRGARLRRQHPAALGRPMANLLQMRWIHAGRLEPNGSSCRGNDRVRAAARAASRSRRDARRSACSRPRPPGRLAVFGSRPRA